MKRWPPACAAELHKVRTTRTPGVLIAAGTLLTLLLAWLVAGVSLPPNVRINGYTSEERLELVLSQAGTAAIFALVFGVLVGAGERHHGTIASTLLATPRRLDVLVGKAAASIGFGGLLGACAALVAVGVGTFHPAVPEPVGADEAVEVVRVVATYPLWALLGLSLGFLVASQTAAVVAACTWLLVVESLLANLRPEVARWLPGGLDRSISGSSLPQLLHPWTAAGLFVLLTATFLAVAGWRFARSDIRD